MKYSSQHRFSKTSYQSLPFRVQDQVLYQYKSHDTHKDCDPCTWQLRPPITVDAPRKAIPKFSYKLKYGHESILGTRDPDGLTDWLSVIIWPDLTLPIKQQAQLKCYIFKHSGLQLRDERTEDSKLESKFDSLSPQTELHISSSIK
jgi:hypothetical protein